MGQGGSVRDFIEGLSDKEFEEVLDEAKDLPRVEIINPMTMKPFSKDCEYENACLFDGWDWKKHPVAHLSCPCPKCTPRY
jgi:hypothetical protein